MAHWCFFKKINKIKHFEKNIRNALCLGVVSALVFPALAHGECYEYDTLGRLISVTYDDQSTVTDYALDKHGNRITVETSSASASVCEQPDGVTSDGETGPVVSSDIDDGTPVPDDGVDPDNRPPITDREDVSVLVGESVTVYPLVGDSDPDGDSISLTGAFTNSTLIAGAQIDGDAVIITAGDIGGESFVNYTIEDEHGGSGVGYIGVVINEPYEPPGDPDPGEDPLPFDDCVSQGILCD